MALTRRLLKGMGLTEDQMDTILEAHTETVDGLKGQVAKYKADAESVPELRKELEKAQADLEEETKGSWKVKYDAMKEEYEGYKTEQAKKETHAAKESAYRELLRQAGVSEKRIAAVLKVTDVDSIDLDSKGNVKNAEKISEDIKKEWSDFIVTSKTSGAETATPPENGASKMSKKDIMKIKDASARKKAIAENHEAFGF